MPIILERFIGFSSQIGFLPSLLLISVWFYILWYKCNKIISENRGLENEEKTKVELQV